MNIYIYIYITILLYYIYYTYIYKGNINIETVEKFNKTLYEIDWNEVKSCEHPSKSYETFLTKFLSIYNFFQRKRQKLKVKTFKVLG